MEVHHLEADTPRRPHHIGPDERVELVLATVPIAPGQRVWVDYRVEPEDAPRPAVRGPAALEHGATRPGPDLAAGRVTARWFRNDGGRSYWRAFLGPFERGARVRYTPRADSPDGDASAPAASFRVGARLHLALMWHQHQPLYKDPAHPTARGSYLQPWVRLHAIRDYYAMAALVAEHVDLHLTINLTPVLLWQLQDYIERGATDRALDLTLTRAEDLTRDQQELVLGTFFDADWHHQIYPHPRYRELLEQRQAGEAFSPQDVRDLQMWFNLAWFAPEFRDGEVRLVTDEVATVRGLVEQDRGYAQDDLAAMVREQIKVMRAIVPIHKALQQRGHIEVATSPFYHPILPLLIDTDGATIDRPGGTHPPRFAHPEDARAQIQSAIAFYRELFGAAPLGMWPAEGAVSQDAAALFAEAGLRWIASDRGVLERSGRWGYRADDPDVLCRPYRIDTAAGAISIFFRDTALSDDIGFHYQAYQDPVAAARDFLRQARERFAGRLDDGRPRVLTVILDGENAWGAYPEDARPFLHALYGELERAPDLATVTFGECLDGDPARAVDAHPANDQVRLYELFTGSWIDENGSAPGVDLGTWIGEEEENRAWSLLLDARRELERAGATPRSHPGAFEALYAAEGSDWFWWFGADQDSGNDAEFDDLFRRHLRALYRKLGAQAPSALDRHIVPRAVPWTFTRPVSALDARDVLTIRTNCPGVLRWQLDDREPQQQALQPAGGVMAGVRRHHLSLGPFPGAARLRFGFRCTHPRCPGTGPCCRGDEQSLDIRPVAP